VVEVAGHLYIEAPKNRKYRWTICPSRTPADYPLAEKLSIRIKAARAEQDAGINPLYLIFPSPKFKLCRSSNFNRNVLQRAYAMAGWRDADGNGKWTGHSLRHVFCTTASAPRPCSPGSSTPPTCPAWPGMPTSAPPC